MKLGLIVLLSGLWSFGARADQNACAKILQANKKTFSSVGTMKTSGYAFAAATPEIYSTGTHTCSHVRDEVVNGQAAEVFREQYQSKAGSTDALIWISKSTGELLREEQDGDVPGKGKGHISYTWTPRTAGAGAAHSEAAGASGGGGAAASGAVRRDGKLPMYPNARNLNDDMPASAIEQGVPMVLETNDPVTKVDAWYKSNASKPCSRTASSEVVKYSCPGGSVMIYSKQGKTEIAFVPGMPPS